MKLPGADKLSLRFLLHWKNGGQNVNLTNLENDFGGTSADWDAQTIQKGVPNGAYRISQIGTSAQEFVQNSGYLKLREIGLYYSFSTSRDSFVKGLRVGVSTSNFLGLLQNMYPTIRRFQTSEQVSPVVWMWILILQPNVLIFTFHWIFKPIRSTIMKKIILNSLLFISASTLFISCQKDYGNLNSPTVESFLSNASASDLNNLVTGSESGMRTNMALYLDDVGIDRKGKLSFLGFGTAICNGSARAQTTPH